MHNSKDNIRQKILQQRRDQKHDDVVSESLNIIDKVLKSKEFLSSNMIMSYVNFENEVVTKDFILKCLKLGKDVCIPYIDKKSSGLIPFQINNLQEDVKKSSYGIIEPRIEKLKRVDPQKIDLVIVPGVAFDHTRNRIGFGKGYYDKFLKLVRGDCYKLAIAFDFQVVSKIPIDPHDMPMDLVITNKKVY